MKSRTTVQFRELYRQLPTDVRRLARQAYRLWQANPQHPGVRFKRVGGIQSNIYSARIGLNWRALALVEDDWVVWWIGSHADYDTLLKSHR